MPELPSGTVTFLLSDIQDAARLRQRLGEGFAETLTEYGDLLRAAASVHHGEVVEVHGDAFLVAFSNAAQAIAAATAAHRAFAAHASRREEVVPVRTGIHSGEPVRTVAGYAGLELHRAARICAAGHGGQVLLSGATAGLARDNLPPGVALRDLGEHRFPDLARPERLFQLVITGLRVDFPPPDSLGSYPTNLPTPTTPLIGRAREVAAVQMMLRQDLRLVTLTGTGGTGKTRVAIEVAAGLLGDFRDGVFFVPLASVADPSLIIPSVAHALGLRDAGERPVTEMLKDLLLEKQMLLVLDNFEQVLDAAPLLTDLLASCPTIKLLVTSRSPLRLRGEQEVAVPPLALPDPHRLPPIEALTDYAAVALCVERARGVRAGFVLTAENAPVIVRICRRLDGLPLAIELASVRLKVLSPVELLARLDRRMVLLTGGPQDLPARQQTIRNTIAWSHDLLRPVEQVLFRRLSVFAGSFTLDAAEAICGSVTGVDVPVLDGLAALVDHSLLHPDDGNESDIRFRMMETIREYASERLEASGEVQAVSAAHLRYFRRLAQEAEIKLRGAEQLEWNRRLESEIDNIRAALYWSLRDAPGARDGLSLAVALTVFWRYRHLREGYDWLGRLLASRVAAGTPLRALALFTAGFLATYTGGMAAALPLVDESIALCQSLGLQQLHAMGRCLRAVGAAYQDDHVAARMLADESIATLRHTGDTYALAIALGWHGEIAARRDDDSTARASWEESVALLQAAGQEWMAASPMGWLGEMAYREGDFASARRWCEQCVTLLQKAEDMTVAVHHLAILGLVALAEGDVDRAKFCCSEGLRICQNRGSVIELPLVLTSLAAVSIARGRPERAVRLLGATETVSRSVGVSLAPFHRKAQELDIEALRAELGEIAFADGWRSGAAMLLGETIAYALMSDELDPSEPALRPREEHSLAVPGEPTIRPIPGNLTAREIEVLRLVATGHTSKEISWALRVAVPTVNRHIANIYTKINARGRADAIAFALRHGLG